MLTPGKIDFIRSMFKEDPQGTILAILDMCQQTIEHHPGHDQLFDNFISQMDMNGSSNAVESGSAIISGVYLSLLGTCIKDGRDLENAIISIYESRTGVDQALRALSKSSRVSKLMSRHYASLKTQREGVYTLDQLMIEFKKEGEDENS